MGKSNKEMNLKFNNKCRECMFYKDIFNIRGICLYPDIPKKVIGSDNCEYFIPNDLSHPLTYI